MRVQCNNTYMCRITECNHYGWHERLFTCHFDTCYHMNKDCECRNENVDACKVDIERILEL
jgi:hypothetical protein